MIYLNIWDNYPAPMYNESFYESCDTLLAISKQTKNINEIVLGDKAKDKIIAYVPHGINEEHFYPITKEDEKYPQLLEAKKQLFGDKEYDRVFFFNSRNIRRKNVSAILAAYSIFKEKLPIDKQDKVALVLHTQPIDDNGTDLFTVRDLFLGEDNSVKFSSGKLSTEGMNYLYNLADITILPSNAEGWGLALTESMMAGTMIMATVTGGMQDQMKFEDENGKWFTPSPGIPSNHRGTYKKHGKWAIPIFPATRNLVGSPKTPYIYDDQLDFVELADKMMEFYQITDQEIKERGLAGREWVTSNESMQSARMMNNNMIKYIDQTIDNFKPRKKFEFIKIEDIQPKKLRHKLVY
jgi:glycosyltransferase involved in cell wall biosynthesis